MLRRFPAACAAAAMCLLLCSPVLAQSTAGDPEPAPADPPPVITKVRNYIEKHPVVQKLKGDGFYPRIGGLPPGSGLAGGAGYRRHLDWMFVDVSAGISTRFYNGVDATLGWIDNDRFDVSTTLTFRHNTQDDFYGLGLDTTDATRVNYGIDTTDVSTRAAVRLTPWLRLGADIGYDMPNLGRGRDANLRNIEEVFVDATAPGLARQPDFVHDSVFAEIDTRDARGFPRRGGFYSAAYALWNDRTLEEYNFRRFGITGSRFVSIAANDVVALRVALSYANNAPGDRVPFYLMPYVGGGDTVRSFREFRFRDENAGVFNAEYRRKVHSFVQVAGFFDCGKVARDWQDINLHDLKNAYGIGIRGGTDERTYVRLDVAHGDGGFRAFFKFTPSF